MICICLCAGEWFHPVRYCLNWRSRPNAVGRARKQEFWEKSQARSLIAQRCKCRKAFPAAVCLERRSQSERAVQFSRSLPLQASCCSQPRDTAMKTLHSHNKSNISIKLLLSITVETCLHMSVDSTETVSISSLCISILFERLTVMNTVIIQFISLNYVNLHTLPYFSIHK